MPPPSFHQRLESALERATQALLAERTAAGPWKGSLSSSALSTATAVCALAVAGRETRAAAGSPPPDSPAHFQPQIEAGLNWLASHVNKDGGWGDTTLSVSNLSTTALCWAAFGAAPGADQRHRALLERVEAWLARLAGGIAPDILAPAIIRRYGKDRTFSVPILTMCALAGRLGTGAEAWRHVIPLPFELAALPPRWFAAVRLPVVSYALPALIAIGQARHWHRPTRNPATRLLRRLARRRTLKVLTRIQPHNGGFLEATPLTSFVVMSLAGSGQADHPVVRAGLQFLLESQRPDGSWPIDTNLATWVTTLAINALTETPALSPGHRSALRDWLLAQQYRRVHPYTQAAPGGWAWTDLPGGVPDADDTAGALIALHLLKSEIRTDTAPPVRISDFGFLSDFGFRISDFPSPPASLREAAIAGATWLLGIQNNDGGIPTFCRGWGALPFDRSSPDLTAHALRAWQIWLEELPAEMRPHVSAAMDRALAYLQRTQRADGAWIPLWFGNQHAPREENPAYGTARVLSALLPCLHTPVTVTLPIGPIAAKAAQWLLAAQHPDGSWGGAPGCPSSVEETALAVQALAETGRFRQLPGPLEREFLRAAVERGALWLIERVESGAWTQPAPIGFYFAKLWYYEQLYPLIFTTGALAKAARWLLSPK